MPRPPIPQEIPDDVALTQYGERGLDGLPRFRDRTREEIGETDVSLILGRVDAASAAVMVTRALRGDAVVRHSTAGELRAQGFRVTHTPTKANSLHVSVHPPIGREDPVDWDEVVAKRFEGCFTETEGGESHGAPRTNA